MVLFSIFAAVFGTMDRGSIDAVRAACVVEDDHPIFGAILRHGLPQAFSETPGRLATGCWAGQHTDDVLKELGYEAERIENLHACGACAVGRERIAP